jgi:hypothetical protein
MNGEFLCHLTSNGSSYNRVKCSQIASTNAWMHTVSVHEHILTFLVAHPTVYFAGT